jgi:hypothetical protein
MNVEELFNSGDKEKDIVSLLDCAYDIMELWKLSDEQVYNKRLKAAWLKRARELGAVPSI